MKKHTRLPRRAAFLAIAFMLLAIVGAGMTSCRGKSPLESAISDALLKGDTTQARFDSICSIIKSEPRQYKKYLRAGEEIDIDALSSLIEKTGQRMRPPRHWDISAYAQQNMSLTIYFERSGSMTPYDSRSGRGQLKKAVNDLINYFPAGQSHVKINIVNSDVYPYKGSIESFLQDRDIYASTRGMGDASYTDFGKIFQRILQAQDAGNISVLVTDMIYSPRDTKDVSASKILNEENSLATAVFNQYKGKSVLVEQLAGDYDGMYYPYNGKPFSYTGTRPFYLIIIANSKLLDGMATNPALARCLTPDGVINSYRFNQGQATVPCKAVADWKDNRGRFRLSHDGDLTFTNCQPNRSTGQLAITLAANLKATGKPDSFVTDAGNYNVTSASGFKISVKPIEPSMVTGNNKRYLDGMTHLITLSASQFKGPRDQVKIALRNDFPQWIRQASTSNDAAPAGNFASTTFGLESFMQGLFGAFSDGGDQYFSITVNLEN